MGVAGLNAPAGEASDAGTPNDPLEVVARETLRHFEVTAARAEEDLANDRPASTSAFAVVNTVTAGEAVSKLRKITEERREGLLRLCSEPAIARLVVLDEANRLKTVYIVRGTTQPTEPNGPIVASYRSPLGRLAAAGLGSDIEVRTANGVKGYELRERAALRPTRAAGAWDAADTVIEAHGTRPVTIISLRALIEEGDDVFDRAGTDLLATLLNQDRAVHASANIFEGRRRAVIEKMGLRDQPLLDQYQDAIFRLPLDARLAILGPPGSGKTTTLIKRLGLKLDSAHLGEDESDLVAQSVAGAEGHAASWLMFTPNELLKLYVREAFAREGIAAPDQRIQTWDDYRRDLGRQRLGILRTATSSGAFLREGHLNLKDETLARQIAWFEDFASWQAEALRAEMAEHARRLTEHADQRVKTLGARLGQIIGPRGGGIDPGTLTELVQQGQAVAGLAKEIRDAVETRLREALSRELRRDQKLLDDLLAFNDGLSDTAEEPEDQDAEEEEEVGSRRGPREEAFEIYKRAARSQARAEASGRSVGRRTRNGRILEWLGARSLQDGERREVGRSLQLLNSLRKFLNPVALYLDRIPVRYRRFRRERQAEGLWYADGQIQALELGPLEVDVIALAMLRAGGALLHDRRARRLAVEPRHGVLGSIQSSYRSQILVDEATDFSPIQLACMAELSDPAIRSFLACGDFNQRLTRWGSRSADDLRWVFPDLDVRSIVVTYRHSRQLRDFAARLAALSGDIGADALMPDHSVGEGFDPVLGTGIGGTGLADWLCARIVEIERITKKLPSIAILVNGDDHVQGVAAELNNRLAVYNVRCTACPNGQVRGQENDVRVFDVQHIKGLEFEAVFFVGVDELARNQPDLFDKYLYVGATRAATYLGLTCKASNLPERLRVLETEFRRTWL
ncbi:DNA helicase UvrD [Methylorubrum populi]|uniref:ATP-binding domain-containing protein n=1 Tax=Methylorubrum populi TaxID=223967 RepID=UPI001151985C|nr:ATP-binding domain-containing protein [Methylorubrum populi]QDI79211.1 DNA helicase UvrD [Methylorubrum populi]